LIANQDAASVRSAFVSTPTPTITQTPTQTGTSALQSSLVAYYDAANQTTTGSGTSFDDITSNNYDGTVSGPTLVTTQPQYYSFDGSNDKINLPSANISNWGSTSFTYIFWVQFESTSGEYRTLFSNYTSANSGIIIGLRNGNIQSFLPGGGTITTSTTPTTNQWYQIAVTKSGTNHKVYLDTVEIGSSTSADATLDNITTLPELGHIPSASQAGWFDGKIALFKVYNTANLNAIHTDYNQNKSRFGIDVPAVTQTATVTRTPSQGFYPADSNVWYDNKYLASEITPLVHLDESSYSSGTLTDLEGNINYTNSGVTTLSGGLYFDGSSYAYASNSLPLSGSYTINVNLTPTTNNNNEAIYAVTTSSASTHGLYFAQEGSTGYYTHRMPLGISGGNISASSVFTADQNVTVTIAWNGDTGEQYIYKNGTQVQYSDTSKDNFPSSVNYHALGALAYSNADRLLNGIIYDFKLFDQYLSAEQIVSINNFHRSNDLVFGTDQYYPNVSLLLHMYGAMVVQRLLIVVVLIEQFQ